MEEEPFLEWLKMGKIKIEKGTIQFLRAHNILLPIRSLFKLLESLKERIGEGETERSYNCKECSDEDNKVLEIYRLHLFSHF